MILQGNLSNVIYMILQGNLSNVIYMILQGNLSNVKWRRILANIILNCKAPINRINVFVCVTLKR